MNSDNRKVHVHNSNACFNCLGQGHCTKDCKNTGRSKKCSKLHHTLLHRDQASNESDETKSSLAIVPSDNSCSVVPCENSSSGAALHHIKPQPKIQTSVKLFWKYHLASKLLLELFWIQELKFP